MPRGQLLPSSDLNQGSSSKGSIIHTSYAPPQQTQHHLSTSSPYCSLTRGLPKSRSSSGAGYWVAQRTKCYTGTPKLHSCQDPSQSWADPEALHAEEPTACGTNDCEGVGSLSVRVEQAAQGFPHPQRKQNTAT
eukprot:14362902-Ditylum_brightwellii.AAC.1